MRRLTGKTIIWPFFFNLRFQRVLNLISRFSYLSICVLDNSLSYRISMYVRDLSIVPFNHLACLFFRHHQSDAKFIFLIVHQDKLINCILAMIFVIISIIDGVARSQTTSFVPKPAISKYDLEAYVCFAFKQIFKKQF